MNVMKKYKSYLRSKNIELEEDKFREDLDNNILKEHSKRTMKSDDEELIKKYKDKLYRNKSL